MKMYVLLLLPLLCGVYFTCITPVTMAQPLVVPLFEAIVGHIINSVATAHKANPEHHHHHHHHGRRHPRAGAATTPQPHQQPMTNTTTTNTTNTTTTDATPLSSTAHPQQEANAIDMVIANRAGVQALRADEFRRSPQVRRIELRGNELQLLPETLFAGLAALQRLDLGANRLEWLDSDVFGGLSDLRELRLDGNCLTVIEGDLFAETRNLEKLYLGGNQLTKIEPGAFRNLLQLTELHLSHNRLTVIPAAFLAGPVNLAKLYANANRITTIEPEAFVHLSHLTQLHLSHNQIHLSARNWSTFAPLVALTQLNLRNNSIDTMLPASLHLPALTRLDLRHNRITNIGGNISHLAHTGFVDVSDNAIEAIWPTGGSGPTDPDYVWIIEDNPICCDGDLFDFLHELTDPLQSRRFWRADGLRCASPPSMRGRRVDTLKLENLRMPLEDWPTGEKPSNTNPSNHTHQLCPSDCDCWALPVERQLLVDCSHTNRTALPAWLPNSDAIGLTAGIVLNVRHNRIERLSGLDAVDAGRVTILDASHNRIRLLDADDVPPLVVALDLRHNQLQELLAPAVRVLRGRVARLGENPWSCPCAAKEDEAGEVEEEEPCTDEARLMIEEQAAELGQCPTVKKKERKTMTLETGDSMSGAADWPTASLMAVVVAALMVTG